jgi:hypothetical protein
VFQDDKQINNFMQMEEEFSTSHIDDVFDDQGINATELEVL